MSSPELPTPPPVDSSTPSTGRPALKGWRKVLLILGVVAFALRVLLALLMHRAPSPARSASPAVDRGHQGLTAGDTLALMPGDVNLAKWSADPAHDGFVVQELDEDGRSFPDPRVCALMPDYITQAGQPGGTLVLVKQRFTGSWQVRWTGGDTMPAMPAAAKKAEIDNNCGRQATLLMSAEQLRDLQAILAGDATVTPPDFQPEIISGDLELSR